MNRIPVSLSLAPTADVTVTINPAAPVSVDTDLATTGDQNTLTFTAANFSDDQYVYFSVAQDLNAGTEMRSLELSAKSDDANYEGKTNTVTVSTNDDDIAMWASETLIDENAGATKVIIEARAGGMSDVERVVTFEVTNGTSSAADYGVTDADGTGTTPTMITIPAEMLVGKDSVTITPVDDDAIEATPEAVSVTASDVTVDGTSNTPAEDGLYVMSFDISIDDADPDVELLLSDAELNEDSGETTVTVTAMLVDGATAPEILSITVAAASGCANASWDENTALRIDAGQPSGSVDVVVTAGTNFDGNDEECDVTATTSETRPSANDPATQVAYTIGTAELKIVNEDESTGN